MSGGVFQVATAVVFLEPLLQLKANFRVVPHFSAAVAMRMIISAVLASVAGRMLQTAKGGLVHNLGTIVTRQRLLIFCIFKALHAIYSEQPHEQAWTIFSHIRLQSSPFEHSA